MRAGIRRCLLSIRETRARDQSSVSLALPAKSPAKIFKTRAKTKRKIFSFSRILEEKQVAEFSQSERHLTQLNLPEVCLEKTIEAVWKCGSCVVEKFAEASENDE